MERRYLASGDRMVLVEFEDRIGPDVNVQVHRLAGEVERAAIPGVREWTPSYRSLGVTYDPLTISFETLVSHLRQLEELKSGGHLAPSRHLEIPVNYGGEMGPDLEFVAQYHQLSIEEVVGIHSGSDYCVAQMGFTPGFPYLLGMSIQIATPRLAEPRKSVPAGAVAIGGQQTGIYSVESPGGWRVIGRTPLKLFDLKREDPFLLKTGDTVRFRAITPQEFQALF